MPSSAFGRVLTTLLLAGSVAACDVFGSGSELEVFVSASPDFAHVGDTITLVGVAYNGSRTTIEAGRGCSYGIGFFVTDSDGVETDLYEGQAFPCPLWDSAELEPGETDVVEWDWVPTEAGTFRVRSAVLLRTGGDVRSSPAEVVVVPAPASGH